MVIADCRNCGKKREVRGGLCEDCQSAKEAERMDSVLGTRTRKTKEQVEKEIAERRKDRKYWWGTKGES
jgi:hypothetical protein